MWPKHRGKVEQLNAALKEFSESHRNLRGVVTDAARETLAMQMVTSLRRLDYTNIIRSRDISPKRADPESAMFDPERAAVWHAKAGRLDEATWLVFLATHFGNHLVHKWRRLRDVYSGLGDGVWTWERVSAGPAAFRSWLATNQHRIGGGFGNHRKYESLNSDSPAGTAAVVASYVDWIGPQRSHAKRFGELVRAGGNDPHSIFGHFYNSMRVARFGRLGKFEFLALLGRLDLAPISPGSAYLVGATGPLRGARLLFSGSPTAGPSEAILEDWLRELDAELNVGMQAMEDSLCNWQKSPTRFVHFRA
jgi:Alpha-glutamyl/putrescinyl thymine pyrophosphorylase clade 3